MTGQAQGLLASIQAPSLSPVALLVLALGLGGLHALTPGQGKTLVAAYHVGSRDTVRHAVALGGIVAITHTASVIAIGLLALFASQFIVPGGLVPCSEALGIPLAMIMVPSASARSRSGHRFQRRAGGRLNGVVPLTSAEILMSESINASRVSRYTSA